MSNRPYKPILAQLDTRHLLGMALATVAGWLVLSGTHAREGWLLSNWPSPRVPFATQGLVWIHLLTALAPAWLATRYLPWAEPAAEGALISSRLWGGLFVVGGGVWGWATIQAGDALPGWTPARTYAESATLRVVWCLVWQFFACAALRALAVRRKVDHDTSMSSHSRQSTELAQSVAALVLTLIAAWSLPGAYAASVLERETVQATRHIQQEQYRLAWTNLQRLVDLSSDRPVGQRSPAEAQNVLRAYLAELVAAVRTPLSPNAGQAEMLERAQVLRQLAYWQEAIELLEPLSKTVPQAAWQLVLLYEERGDLERSVEASASAWRLLAGDTSVDATRLREELLVKWAHNLRRLRRFREAETQLHGAREVLPQESGLVDFELGYHYKESGFHNRARQYLERAARDPRFSSKVDEEIAALDAEMSYCMPLPTSIGGVR